MNEHLETVESQRDRLLAVIIGVGIPVADVGQYVHDIFKGDYELAVRFAIECVVHLHSPGGQIKPPEASSRTTGGRAGRNG